MLKYSHKIHLNPKGVSSPSGDIVMTCPDCHKTDEAGNHFAPMTMKNTCQQSGCHSLYFEAPAEGRVPHGSEHEVMSRLRDFYTKWLAQSPANRSSCRNFDGADCASSLAKENAAKSLFNPNAGCIDCHEIESTNDLENPWLITPLRINRDWHTGAAFSHVKHGAVACESCHDKMSSKLSKDVSMPSIDKCRECHIGEATARGKITSYCDSCHKFHKAK